MANIGTLPVPVQAGGTGAATLTAHGVLIGEGTSAVTALAAGSAGQALLSGGASADPAYSTATYPLTTTINQVLYSSSANVIAGLATANNAILNTDGSGVPSLTATPSFTSLTLTGAGLIPISLVSTDPGAAKGPVIDVYRNSASPAASDSIGSIEFNGVNASSAKTLYARAAAFIETTTAAAEDGNFQIITIKNGSTTEAARFRGVSGISTNGGTDYFGYSTGTWTPALARTSLNITYTSQTGTYIKVGKLVFCQYEIVVNAVTNAGSGSLTMTGLPTTTATGSNYISGNLYTTATISAADMAYLQVTNNSTACYLFFRNYTTNANLDISVTAGCNLNGWFVYYSAT